MFNLCNFGLIMAWYFGFSIVVGTLMVVLGKEKIKFFALLRFYMCLPIILLEDIFVAVFKKDSK